MSNSIKQTNIKTLQYDATRLSNVSEEYLARSLSNLGQRFGEQGDGFTIKTVKISDNDFFPQAEGAYNYIELYYDDTSKSYIFLKNGNINNVADTIKKSITYSSLDYFDETIKNVSYSINDSTITLNFNYDDVDCQYIINDNVDGYECTIGDEVFISHVGQNITLTIDEDTKYTLVWNENNNLRYSLTTSNTIAESIINTANTIYSKVICGDNGIIELINGNYYEKQYEHALIGIYDEIVNNLAFVDNPNEKVTSLTNGCTSIYIPKEFEFEVSIDTNDGYLQYSTNDLKISVIGIDDETKISEYKETITNSKNICCFLSNISTDYIRSLSLNVNNFALSFNPNYNENKSDSDDVISVNIYKSHITFYDPFIHNTLDTWCINNVDSGICAVGLNAGQPNIVIVRTSLDGDENVKGTIILDASDMTSDSELSDVEFTWENGTASLINGYSNQYKNTDIATETRTYYFAIPNMKDVEYSQNQLTMFKNMLIMNISNIYQNPSTTGNLLIESGSSIEDTYYIDSPKWMVTFWLFKDNDGVYSFECVCDTDETPLDLFTLTCSRELADYVIQLVKDDTVLDEHLETYLYKYPIKFKYITITPKNSEEIKIYPYFDVTDNNSGNRLNFKFGFGDTLYNKREVINSDNSYFLNYQETQNGEGTYYSDYASSLMLNGDELVSDIPTIDFSEVLQKNVTTINRINLMMFKSSTDSSNNSLVPYYAYLGNKPNNEIGYDGYFHIGTNTYNTNLGTEKLATESFASALQRTNGFMSDFTNNYFENIVSNYIINTIDSSKKDSLIAFINSANLTSGFIYSDNMISYSKSDFVNNLLGQYESLLNGGIALIEKVVSVPTTNDITEIKSTISNLESGESYLYKLSSYSINADNLSAASIYCSSEFTLGMNAALKLNNNAKIWLDTEGKYYISNTECKLNSATANYIESKDFEVIGENSSVSIKTDEDSVAYITADYTDFGWERHSVSLGKDITGTEVTNTYYTKDIKLVGQNAWAWIYADGEGKKILSEDFLLPNTYSIASSLQGKSYYPLTYIYDSMFMSLYDGDSTTDTIKESINNGASDISAAVEYNSYINIKKLCDEYIPKYIKNGKQIYINAELYTLIDTSSNTSSLWYSYDGSLFKKQFIANKIYDATNTEIVEPSNSTSVSSFVYYPLIKLNKPLNVDNYVNKYGTNIDNVKFNVVTSPLISLTLSVYKSYIVLNIQECSGEKEEEQLFTLTYYDASGENLISGYPTLYFGDNSTNSSNIKSYEKGDYICTYWEISNGESQLILPQLTYTIEVNSNFNTITVDNDTHTIKTPRSLRLVPHLVEKTAVEYTITYIANRTIKHSGTNAVDIQEKNYDNVTLTTVLTKKTNSVEEFNSPLTSILISDLKSIEGYTATLTGTEEQVDDTTKNVYVTYTNNLLADNGLVSNVEVIYNHCDYVLECGTDGIVTNTWEEIASASSSLQYEYLNGIKVTIDGILADYYSDENHTKLIGTTSLISNSTECKELTLYTFVNKIYAKAFMTIRMLSSRTSTIGNDNETLITDGTLANKYIIPSDFNDVSINNKQTWGSGNYNEWNYDSKLGCYYVKVYLTTDYKKQTITLYPLYCDGYSQYGCWFYNIYYGKQLIVTMRLKNELTETKAYIFTNFTIYIEDEDIEELTQNKAIPSIVELIPMFTLTLLQYIDVSKITVGTKNSANSNREVFVGDKYADIPIEYIDDSTGITYDVSDYISYMLFTHESPYLQWGLISDIYYEDTSECVISTLNGKNKITLTPSESRLNSAGITLLDSNNKVYGLTTKILVTNPVYVLDASSDLYDISDSVFWTNVSNFDLDTTTSSDATSCMKLLYNNLELYFGNNSYNGKNVDDDGNTIFLVHGNDEEDLRVYLYVYNFTTDQWDSYDEAFKVEVVNVNTNAYIKQTYYKNNAFTFKIVGDNITTCGSTTITEYVNQSMYILSTVVWIENSYNYGVSSITLTMCDPTNTTDTIQAKIKATDNTLELADLTTSSLSKNILMISSGSKYYLHIKSKYTKILSYKINGSTIPIGHTATFACTASLTKPNTTSSTPFKLVSTSRNLHIVLK